MRNNGITKPIILLHCKANEIEEYIKYNLDVTFCSLYDLSLLESILTVYNKNINLHIPVDTGMNRFGIKYINDFECLIKQLTRYKHINLYGLYTHLYSNTKIQINNQFDKFTNFVDIADKYKYFPKKHYISSGYIDSELIDKQSDFVRIGIGNYTKTTQSTTDCVELYSKVIETKNIIKGEIVGYNNMFVAPKNMNIAVVFGGYNDGISRNFIDYKVKICNRYYPIIAICMDVFFVNIYNDTINENEDVQILSIVDDIINIDTLAKSSKLSKHEILAGLKGRIKTIYKNK